MYLQNHIKKLIMIFQQVIYIKELGYDEKYPYIALPVQATTGGSTVGYCDYFQGAISGNYIPYFGGYYGNGDSSGLFCMYLIFGAGSANANLGARLLKIPE